MGKHVGSRATGRDSLCKMKGEQRVDEDKRIDDYHDNNALLRRHANEVKQSSAGLSLTIVVVVSNKRGLRGVGF